MKNVIEMFWYEAQFLLLSEVNAFICFGVFDSLYVTKTKNIYFFNQYYNNLI